MYIQVLKKTFMGVFFLSLIGLFFNQVLTENNTINTIGGFICFILLAIYFEKIIQTGKDIEETDNL